MDKINKKIVVLDMQPIDPPVGGGRLRLLGLYHNLGENLTTKYIGTYDWPGENYRDHKLSDTLREVDIPLSDEHFAECRKWQERVEGKTIIDATFPQLAYLSQQYVDYVRKEIVKADIVIFSHPWVYPLVKDLLNKDTQLIIYDSQNVEGYLRFTLLDDGGFGTEIVRNVVKTEYELCHQADVIFACSSDDCELFTKLYKVPVSKIKIVPNGVFTEKLLPVALEKKKSKKHQLGLDDRKAAIFIGSNYLPNLEACDFILKELAPVLPEVMFVIAGGIGEGIQNNTLNNVRITGYLSEEKKIEYLEAADMAINPMFSGSGTNIKMFDFMAAGLPIISTAIGSRGITNNDYAGIIVCDRFDIKSTLQDLINNERKIEFLGEANRELVERNYSWERISPQLGTYLLKKVGSSSTLHSSISSIKENRKIAIMSSWNIRCGIAEHTRYLANELEAKNIDFRIIANSNYDLASPYFIDDISREIYLLWKYDYLRWTDTSIDINGILNALIQDGVSKFNIQYHTGFYNQNMLMELVRVCINADIEVSVSLHNSKEVYPNTLAEISNLGVRIIVHSIEEKKLLDSQGIQNVFQIPLGVLDFPDEEKFVTRNKLGVYGNPVIGSFGFLRPHKGVIEAIEAVSILRENNPNIKFLGINALYPSDDSKEYLEACNDRIKELKLTDNVVLLTSYLDMNQIINYLHASDLIVLPYHESKEGSSAAANTAISSKRPLVISNSGIFSAIKSVSHEIVNIDPSTIATEIQNLLLTPELLDKMKTKIVNYVHENSYMKIADQYIEFILGQDLK